MKNAIIAFGTGVLFAVGLAVGGMTQPAKVVAFLDFFGNWDPSLAFVMGGAIAVYLPLYWLVTKRNTPMFAARFLIPTRRDLDKRLLAGSALFGIGWGLGGFCPGPGLTSTGSLMPAALVFTAAMFGGFLLHSLWDNWTGARKRRRESGEGKEPVGQPATGRMS